MTAESPRATAAHVFLLWGLAVAQPLYDVLGRNAELFVARRTPPSHLWGLAALVSLAAPALLVALLAALRALGERWHTAALLALVAALAGIVTLPVSKRGVASTGVILLGAAVAGGVAAIAYRRSSLFRQFLTFFSPAALIFPALFLLASPVARLAVSPRAATTGGASRYDVPVVVIVFDALPTSALMDAGGAVDAALYPSFARLAGRSTWFRQARAVAPATMQAVPALLTGTSPGGNKLPFLEDYPGNLFTLLGRGAPAWIFESITWLCPTDLCGEGERRRDLGLFQDVWVVLLHVLGPPELAARLPSLDQRWYGFDRATARRHDEVVAATPGQRALWRRAIRDQFIASRREARVQKLDRFLAGLPSPGGGSLSFLHLDLPHEPFVFLPSGRRYLEEGDPRADLLVDLLGVPGQERGLSAGLAELAYRRMLLQLGFTDRVLGEILDRLEQRGLLDPALLVVTADHGQTFAAGHGRRDMADGDTLHVPLFVKSPRQRQGVVDDRPADSRDVVPTIAELLEIELPWAVDGRPLTAPSGSPAASPAAAWSDELVAAWRRKLDRVGAGDPLRVTALGPAGDLLGRPLAEAAAAGLVTVAPAAADARAGLLHGAELAEIDPSGDFLPAYLLGQIQTAPGDGPPPAILLTLDGAIRATGWTFAIAGRNARFALLLPEEALTPGPHRWELFGLDGVSGGSTPRLTPFPAWGTPPR